MADTTGLIELPEIDARDEVKAFKLWKPKRVVFNAETLDLPYGKQLLQRIQDLNLKIDISKNNRVTGLKGKTEKETYQIAKSTMAI
jgi:spore photoproduct lyase